uniref:Uncharacterized protein n=1 Tax=Ananas comosus var. bracteatus TaxID=296719 RepID=A0A6V7PUG5_ANACO|nr:unnamed protein product [Ananas comosus var. bracteatus]
MADDNVMNLRNRAIPRSSGNDQASSSENANKHHAVLPVGNEISEQSAHQEPNLIQELEQITRVLQVLDQNNHRSTAPLDAVLAAITAFDEIIARNGQLLIRNEQPVV